MFVMITSTGVFLIVALVFLVIIGGGVLCGTSGRTDSPVGLSGKRPTHSQAAAVSTVFAGDDERCDDTFRDVTDGAEPPAAGRRLRRHGEALSDCGPARPCVHGRRRMHRRKGPRRWRGCVRGRACFQGTRRLSSTGGRVPHPIPVGVEGHAGPGSGRVPPDEPVHRGSQSRSIQNSKRSSGLRPLEGSQIVQLLADGERVGAARCQMIDSPPPVMDMLQITDETGTVWSVDVPQPDCVGYRLAGSPALQALSVSGAIGNVLYPG